jgi:mRNA-degrading endonuclease RelE of RelBE toxin-antitoxin system
MADFQFGFNAEAKKDFDFFSARERKTIAARLKKQLAHEPLKETRNRKRLRDSSLAPWELRIGHYRVFYKVEEHTVTIVAVGSKDHNKLFIRGKEVQL